MHVISYHRNPYWISCIVSSVPSSFIILRYYKFSRFHSFQSHSLSLLHHRHKSILKVVFTLSMQQKAAHTTISNSRILTKPSGYPPGMLYPPRGKTGCPAPPRPAKSRPCPTPPRKIDEIRGAQRGKADCKFQS